MTGAPGSMSAAFEDSGSLVVLPERPRRRNNLMLVVGFLGVLLILGGTLPVPYTGGYLLERFVPVGGDVIGTLGVILLAGVGAVAVLCAVQLPRYLAVALLAGTALASAVPALVAVVAVLAGAPVALGGAVWFALAGAVLLGAAGGLSQVRLVSVRADDWSARPGSRVWVGVSRADRRRALRCGRRASHSARRRAGRGGRRRGGRPGCRAAHRLRRGRRGARPRRRCSPWCRPPPWSGGRW